MLPVAESENKGRVILTIVVVFFGDLAVIVH
jgi:hypothetical protein